MFFGASCARKKTPVAAPRLSSPCDRIAAAYFSAPDYPASVSQCETLAQSPTFPDRNAMLFRLAMAYALSGSPVRDGAHARQLLQQIVASSDDANKEGAQYVLELEARVDSLTAEVSERDKTIETLKANIQDLNAQLQQAKEADAQALAKLQDQINQLTSEMNKRDQKVADLTRELKRLREIDMQRKP